MGFATFFIFPLATFQGFFVQGIFFQGDFHTVPLLATATPARVPPSGLASQGGWSPLREEPPGKGGNISTIALFASAKFAPRNT